MTDELLGLTETDVTNYAGEEYGVTLGPLHFFIDFRKCQSHSQTWPWQLIIRLDCPQEIHLKFKTLPMVAHDKLSLTYLVFSHQTITDLHGYLL